MSGTDPIPRPTERVRPTDLEDELVFYDAERDRVHVLNSTARTIYLLCDGRRSEGEICEAFAELFDDAGEQARRDARDVLGQLVELELVVR